MGGRRKGDWGGVSHLVGNGWSCEASGQGTLGGGEPRSEVRGGCGRGGEGCMARAGTTGKAVEASGDGGGVGGVDWGGL